MKFQRGKSGNPSGRPKKTEEDYNLEAAARGKAPAAMETLLTIMEHGENERNRMSAAQYILERGFGKAAQPVTGKDDGAVQVEVTNKDQAEVTHEELIAELKRRGLPTLLLEE